MNKNIKISQSLMKSLFAYMNGEKCGKLIEEHYINGVPFPSSEFMELGNYFEYICTGSPARDGHIPEAQTTKKGEPTSKYKIMDLQKENFDRVMKKYGFKLKSIDYTFETEDSTGIADIIAEKDGETVIIDVKTSGLINDKWKDTGWHEEAIERNEKLLVQAKHYKVMAEDMWGIENVPFYFFVFSNTNAIDHKVFLINCSPDTLEIHRENVQGAKKLLEKYLEEGFKTIPNYKECADCPLKESCQDFTDVPKIYEVQI